MRSLPIVPLLLASCFAAAVLAEAPLLDLPDQPRPKSGGTIHVYIENDSFANTDRNYTSGVKFGWSSPDLSKFSETPVAKPFLPVLNVVPFINEPADQKNLVLALGQNYTPGYYSTSPASDPTGPGTGYLYRILRGGGWGDTVPYLRCSYRWSDWPDDTHLYHGFRVARRAGP